ncbi:acyltransferase family protein [Flavobacterium aquatile]|uniref:Acyltransferase 3 domain-containing protein n=1 Tax=Flavobacterium aquatile LMG 4008 = ATCC 11947 TaxID=1453498 RepID=A0A095STF6_9FLAO|nr:acyltransferase [Flavobacterium aquatile]KGD67594.1 hypothetical protein LG45_10700 [Flavobacterium aquatile LMG 4008 = ATCC 11947]OXA67456.1 acyltransferase [Flavobacterium aquatile] [Flavobacterium aquatile LMG 4008 = ATCC 11947]GEC79217.1 acyltransferase [Flavobacterium aquatile]
MKLNYIDSIRGVAILMVILGHIGQEVRGLSLIPHLLTSYGQMGVQLFFVASAYTLCLSASNRITESHQIKKYAIRRFFRIAPLYYIGLIVYFLFDLSLLWNKNGTFSLPEKYTLINVLSNLFFFHGFYPPANNNIVPGGWSIGTEMAFYVVFPLLFYYFKKWTSGSFGKALLILLVVFIISQLIFVLVYNFMGLLVKNNNFLYYNLVNQISVFCVGIVFFLFEKNTLFTKDWKFDLIVFVALTSISLVLWNCNWLNIFSVIPVLSAISFVFLINIFNKNNKLNLNFLLRIGAVSYSMYIIHFIFLFFSALVSLKFSQFINKNIILVVMYLLTVMVTFVFASISERYIEKPFINIAKKIIHKIH